MIISVLKLHADSWQLPYQLIKVLKKKPGDVDNGFRCFPLIKFQDQKLCFTFT